MKPEQMMQAQEDFALAVASLTGLKAQFIDVGWTPEGAEQMTIQLIKGASK